MKSIVFMIISLVVLSCDSQGGVMSERESQLKLLNQNRNLWNSKEVRHYKFNQSKMCYCVFENDQYDWDIEIKSSDSPYMLFNNNIVNELPDYALSIDQLFDQIENELNRDPYPYTIDIAYHSEYGFPENFSIDIDAQMADEEYAYKISDFKIIDCGPKSYTGKLVLKGICMNYVIQVIDGNIDPDQIEGEWTFEGADVVYNDVFALGSVCDFPEDIEEGDTFQFYIQPNDSDQNCAVCLAYSPTPEKSLHIKVCE